MRKRLAKRALVKVLLSETAGKVLPFKFGKGSAPDTQGLRVLKPRAQVNDDTDIENTHMREYGGSLCNSFFGTGLR